MRGRKLTFKEQYEKRTSKVMTRLDALAKIYSLNNVKTACHRYLTQVRDMDRLKKHVQKNERELAELTKKMNSYRR
jgi:hypothetical protein